MRHLSRIIQVACVAALFCVVAEVDAQPKELKFSQEWRGSVADATLMKGAPEVIASTKALEKLWATWKLDGKVPNIDFSKEIVVVGTTSGSRISLGTKLDDKGNLSVLGIATADFGPGFRYVLGAVSREGVKTVNKKELPKD